MYKLKLYNILQELCKNYSKEINVEAQIVERCLENLRKHSYKKFVAREKFKSDGIASLSIKMSGEVNYTGPVDIEIDLQKSVTDLKQIISNKLERDIYCLKMIFNGKLLENDPTLSSQGVQVFYFT